MDQFPVITDEGVAKLKKWVGVKHVAEEQFNRFASADAIRHFAQGFGDTNPLYNDDEYGKKTKYGCMIAPLCFLTSTHRFFPHEGLPGIHSMWAGIEFEGILPIKVDNRIIVTSWLSDVIERPKSEFSRRSIHQGWTYEFTNQKNELLATGKEWLIRTERGSAKERGKYNDIQLAHYNEEQIKAIEADYDAEVIRGAVPRYWEDVKENEELPKIVKGPFSITDTVAWKIGWGFHPFTRAHKLRLEYQRKHPGIVFMNKYGAPDVPERVHWDPDYARRVGVPNSYDHGPQRITWVCQTVTNWMGDDGFIKHYDCRATRFNLEGDTTWCKGKINKKYVKGGEHLVDIQLWTENQNKVTTADGSATVRLLTKGKKK